MCNLYEKLYKIYHFVTFFQAVIIDIIYFFLTIINIMFFLTVHFIVDKYYPQIFSQFIIGVVCYIITYLILSEFISVATYNEYKYYLGSLVSIDLAYLIYIAKYQKNVQSSNIYHQEPNVMIPPKISEEPQKLLPSINNKLDALRMECHSGNNKLLSPTYSVSASANSEINDFKITHDSSHEEELEGELIFSNTEQSENRLVSRNNDNSCKAKISDNSESQTTENSDSYSSEYLAKLNVSDIVSK